MTRRRRRQRAAGNRGPFITLVVLGAATVAGVIALFVLLGGDDGEPPSEVLEPTADDHVLGVAAAPVTVVEYADFQ